MHCLKKLTNMFLLPIEKSPSPKEISLLIQSPQQKILASLVIAREKSVGNLLFRMSEPNQLSYQKNNSFSLPTSHLELSSNDLSQISSFQTSFKSLNQREFEMRNLCSFKLLQPPYLDSRISFQCPPLLKLKCQIHFSNKVALKSLILRMPRSLAFRDSHTLSQDTQTIFLPSDPQPHEKFLCIDTIFFNTVENILNKDK